MSASIRESVQHDYESLNELYTKALSMAKQQDEVISRGLSCLREELQAADQNLQMKQQELSKVKITGRPA